MYVAIKTHDPYPLSSHHFISQFTFVPSVQTAASVFSIILISARSFKVHIKSDQETFLDISNSSSYCNKNK